MIKHVKTFEEYKELIKTGKVLVDFYASWCGPCRMLAPVLEEIDEENIIKDLLILKIDVDEAPSIAAQYNVQSIPTILLFKNGELINQSLGFMPKPIFINLLKDNF